MPQWGINALLQPRQRWVDVLVALDDGGAVHLMTFHAFTSGYQLTHLLVRQVRRARAVTISNPVYPDDKKKTTCPVVPVFLPPLDGSAFSASAFAPGVDATGDPDIRYIWIRHAAASLENYTDIRPRLQAGLVPRTACGRVQHQRRPHPDRGRHIQRDHRASAALHVFPVRPPAVRRGPHPTAVDCVNDTTYRPSRG